MTPACPRCPDTVLVTSNTHGIWVMYCARCWGLWVDHASVRHVAGVAVDGATAAHGESLPCPICRAGLRAWTARGVVIDRCDAHGVWFDRAELDQLVALAHSGSGRSNSTAAAAATGVAVVAGAVLVAGVAADSSGRMREEWQDTAANVVDSVSVAVPFAEAGGELVAGAGELASGAGHLAVAGVEGVAGLAEVGAEAAGGVLEGVAAAVGAIFELFS